MFQKNIISISLLCLVFVGCKTQEEIAREKMVDTLSVQMIQSQKINSDNLVKIQDLENKILQVGGQVEDNTHSQSQSMDQKNQSIQSKMLVLEESNKVLKEQLNQQTSDLRAVKKQLKEQKSFLNKVLKNIQKISKSPSTKSKKKSAKKLSKYDQAMKDYRRGRYKTSKTQLLELLDSKKIKGNKKARVIHNLGMISYMDKKNQDAVVYFSRLFTEYPKAPYLPNGLLYLAKAFKRDKKKDQAKQTLNELIKKYPKALQTKEAKLLLKKL